jgi:hypothetical protein
LVFHLLIQASDALTSRIRNHVSKTAAFNYGAPAPDAFSELVRTRIALDLLRGVEKLANAEMVHCDLKGANSMLGPENAKSFVRYSAIIVVRVSTSSPINFILHKY